MCISFGASYLCRAQQADKDKTDKENDQDKSDSTKTKPITIDKTKPTNDLENIDKQFKYWYAYSESHY